MTWADLIAEVRAQIDASDDQAFAWLLDRARVLNAESGWLLAEAGYNGDGQGTFELPPDSVRVEALSVDGYPYQRRTLTQMDQAKASYSSVPVYSDDAPTSDRTFAVWPAPPVGAAVTLRYLQDVAAPDDRAVDTPPFPADITPILADGAIGLGIARMDERFDSAGYFDARFTDGVQRLKRRRHGRVGRGSIPIRIVR
jgi:hypothetical protein